MSNVIPEFKDIKTITGIIATMIISLTIIIGAVLLFTFNAEIDSVRKIFIILLCIFSFFYLLVIIAVGWIIYKGKAQERFLGNNKKSRQEFESKIQEYKKKILADEAELKRQRKIIGLSDELYKSSGGLIEAMKETRFSLVMLYHYSIFALCAQIYNLFILQYANYKKETSSEGIMAGYLSGKKYEDSPYNKRNVLEALAIIHKRYEELIKDYPKEKADIEKSRSSCNKLIENFKNL